MNSRQRRTSRDDSGRRDEPPTGALLLRNGAFKDLPPTVYFGRKDFPGDVFKPSAFNFTPVVLYKGMEKVIVKEIFKSNGFLLTYNPANDFIINWVRANSKIMYTKVKPYQKYNHIPRSGNLGVKTLLNKWISEARKRHPKEYDFHSEGYLYPDQTDEIEEMIARENDKLRAEGKTYKAQFIKKPTANSRGNGIGFIREIKELEDINKETGKQNRYLVQKYIESPLLINGKKADVRIYVLVTGVSPLRIYVFDDGIVRIATKNFIPLNEDNDVSIHLTNTEVALKSGKFVAAQTPEGENDSNEWTLKHLIKFIKEEQKNPNSVNNYKGIDADMIWEQIKEISKKTIIAEKSVLMENKDSVVTVDVSELQEKCLVTDDNGSLSLLSDSLKKYKKEGTTGEKDDEFMNVKKGANFENKEEEEDKVIFGCGDLPVCHPLAHYDHAVYDSCFEMFGFDYLIDSSGKVWLIEVNISPSAETPSILDRELKDRVFSESFNIVGLNKYCGARYESAVTGKPLMWSDLAQEKIKLSIDEFYRSYNTSWVRVYPDNDPETLKLFETIDPLDRYLMRWCLNPTFEGDLSTVRHNAKEKILSMEQDIASHSSLHIGKMAYLSDVFGGPKEKRVKEVPL